MKFIKKFEFGMFGSKEEYEIGDYILVRYEYMNRLDKIIKAKIVSFNRDAHFPIKIMDDKNEFDTIQPPNVMRHLTPEEINEYEMLINANKYNL